MALPQIETITTDTGPYLIEVAKQKDLEVIMEVLTERGDPLTLDNARFVLAIGLKNKPAAWTVTPEELPALWAELIEAVAG